MAGVKARTFDKRIASLLAEKWNREYSKLVVFVCVKMALTVVRTNTLLLCGVWVKRPKWIPFVDDGALESFPGLCEL